MQDVSEWLVFPVWKCTLLRVSRLRYEKKKKKENLRHQRKIIRLCGVLTFSTQRRAFVWPSLNTIGRTQGYRASHSNNLTTSVHHRELSPPAGMLSGKPQCCFAGVDSSVKQEHQTAQTGANGREELERQFQAFTEPRPRSLDLPCWASNACSTYNTQKETNAKNAKDAVNLTNRNKRCIWELRMSNFDIVS